MPAVHTIHTRARHSGGGRHCGVAILRRADVAMPERNSSEINPGIKQNRIIIHCQSKKCFNVDIFSISIFTEHYYD